MRCFTDCVHGHRVPKWSRTKIGRRSCPPRNRPTDFFVYGTNASHAAIQIEASMRIWMGCGARHTEGCYDHSSRLAVVRTLPTPFLKSQKSAHISFFVMYCTLLENARQAVHPQCMLVNLQARGPRAEARSSSNLKTRRHFAGSQFRN